VAEVHPGLQEFLDRDHAHPVTPFLAPARPVLIGKAGREDFSGP